jgi:hypothetical protein
VTALYEEKLALKFADHRPSINQYKTNEEEEREVGSNERHYGWGGAEYIISFEGSQALPVCPSGKCKLLTGIIFFGVGGEGLTGCVRRKFLN